MWKTYTQVFLPLGQLYYQLAQGLPKSQNNNGSTNDFLIYNDFVIRSGWRVCGYHNNSRIKKRSICYWQSRRSGWIYVRFSSYFHEIFCFQIIQVLQDIPKQLHNSILTYALQMISLFALDTILKAKVKNFFKSEKSN